MQGTTADCAAFAETVVFLSHFKELNDPRQQGKVDYPLDEILLLCLLAVLAGAETIVDIALFGRKKLELLRRFRPFSKGTPAHDWHTITSATSWPCWTRSSSSAASSPGSPR
jgi:hypothetical protein